MDLYHCISELILQWKPWTAHDNPSDAMETAPNALIGRYIAPGGDIVIGKIVLLQYQLCYMYYSPSNVNIVIQNCEYLVQPTGYSGDLKWETRTPGNIPCGALVGGRSADGTDILYIAKTTYYNLDRPGSYSTVKNCIFVKTNRLANQVACKTSFSFLIYREGM